VKLKPNPKALAILLEWAWAKVKLEDRHTAEARRIYRRAIRAKKSLD
jgi:hypothetical protein